MVPHSKIYGLLLMTSMRAGIAKTGKVTQGHLTTSTDSKATRRILAKLVKCALTA
jgi:hypothetical protein